MTASTVAFLDFFVGGGIFKFAFPQHPAEVPRLFPVDKIPDGKRHRGAVLFDAGDFQQFVQRFFVQFDGHSHATKMMLFSSFVNRNFIIIF